MTQSLLTFAYGKPDASEEEVYDAARKAHVHDTILKLEGGEGYKLALAIAANASLADSDNASPLPAHSCERPHSLTR